MSILSKLQLISDVASNIYTNTQRLIKGNTVKARLLNIVDSTFIRVVDTASNFTANNQILSTGEIGIESDSLTTSPKFKIGDGVTTWNTLPYSNVGSETLQQAVDNGNTVLQSDNATTLFKVDRVNNEMDINGTFYSTSLDNGSALGVRDGDSYLAWQNKTNPQTVGEVHFNSTKGEYFYEKTSSGTLLAGGRLNIDLTLMLIKHLTKISLSSPLIEVSQNPTTALGIATKQYVDASVPSLSTNLISLSSLSFISTSFVKMSATGTFTLDTNTYLTSNQTITLSGEASGSGTTSIAVTLNNTSIINKVLTGYVSGAGTISTTDSILSAIQKLNGNITTKENILTVSSGLTRATNTITNNLITGLSGGQTIIGGTGASENLTLSSTSNATKGFINIVDTTKITNTSGGVLSNAGGNSGYLNIVGSTANNTNYPNISFIGGTTTLASMPYISSQNAGNAIEMFAGGSKLYLDGNNGLIYYNQILGNAIPFVVDANRNTRIDRNNVLYNPTNYANLTIGAATQNGYVSLVISEGTLNVVPGVIPSGGMYNEGGRLWFREGSTLNKALVGAIYTQTSSVTVTNTVTETSVLNSTITLPANTLNIGKTIRFKLSGLHSAVSSPTIRIKVKLGTTIILDTTAVTTSNLTNGIVVIEGDITCRTTGTSGSVYGQGLYNEYGTTNNFNQMINTGATTINTTTSQVLDVTVTWGTASVSDSLTITNGCVEIIN
jgi:membrane-bound inhibitor of C-type lysozyme